MSNKEYNDHKLVPKKYVWDLESLLENKTYKYWFDKWSLGLKELIKVKDSKYESSKQFLDSIKLEEKNEIIFNKIYNYISNSLNQNIASPEFKKLNDELEYKYFQFSQELGSETNRIFQNEKKIRQWLKIEEFKNYKKKLIAILEEKKHKLQNNVEDFLTQTSRANISAASTFEIITDSELDYGYAVSKSGKKTKITNANRVKLLKKTDENIRKSTYFNYRKGYLNHKQSLANLLFQHFKRTTVIAKARKFDSAVSSQIMSDKVDVQLLETLYSSVQENIISIKRYANAKNKFFKSKYNKKYKPWDSNLPLVKVKNEYTPEEGQELILKALTPMGPEYIKKIKEAYDNGWIDYMPVKNKRSGAYSIGASFGLNKKYILMNWDGELRSVETLIHELGHSMHSYYSDTRQPQSLSGYPIFLAEIASIFNELMLIDYLLETSNDDKLKFQILEAAITGFNGTVVRQTMWSNYEFELLKAIESGKSVSSYEAISKLYFDTIKKYSVENKPKYKADDCWGSIMVPHYYYGFYVYKYAIGYVVAMVFFNKYKKNGRPELQRYINDFLSAGGRDWPIQILKDAGIDLYDHKIYKEAFKQLDLFVDEYIKIGKKFFK